MFLGWMHLHILNLLALHFNFSFDTMMSSFKSWGVMFTSLHLLLQLTSSHFIVKNLPGFGPLPFKLETGYIGVGDQEDVQLFYYFVESESNSMNDPFLLWLIGGPGSSALSGLFYENGPLEFNYQEFNGIFPELRLNSNGWTKVFNILYIDSPVGTGFSYSKTQLGYYSNDKIWVDHVYDFLHKWLVDHPKFTSNSLYIGGGSYSAIITAPLVEKVYEDYRRGRSPFFNFKGFVLSCPVVDPLEVNNSKVEFAHQRTLISNELYKSIKASCNGNYVNLDPNNRACMSDYEAYYELVRYINEGQIMNPSCKRESHENHRSMFEDFKNIHQTYLRCMDNRYAITDLWANDPNVRKALNIREGTKGRFQRWNHSVAHQNNIPSIVEYLRNLTNTNLRSLIYNGDVDMSAPYPTTHSMIKSFNLKVNTTWRTWFVDNEVAGYTETYKKNEYQLTYAIIKGGSHVAQEQEQQAKVAFQLIARWLSGYEI